MHTDTNRILTVMTVEGEYSHFENLIQIDYYVYFLLALFALILPAKYLLSFFTAAMIHEAGHIISSIALGGQINCIKFTFVGARIDVWHKNTNDAIIATLAGPLSGFLLIFLYPSFPLLSMCGCAQGIINLLPFFPLDGGRIVRILHDEKYSLH